MLKPSQSEDADLTVKGGNSGQHPELSHENEFIPASQWGQEVRINRELVKSNLREIQIDIAHSKVKIVAVTKYFGLDAILAGYEAGIRNFGESRALEAIEKIEKLPDDIRKNSTFHFIGHLQSNKAEKVVEHFDVIESVDSLKLAKKISEAACRLNKKEKVLLQVNNAGEEQKSGYSKEELRAEFKDIISLEGIEVSGLMNMAPLDANEDELAKLFYDIREFRDELEKEFNVTLPELSMGMSNDYKIALREGATIIRIGRKLFT